MAMRKIRTEEDPVLHKVSRHVDVFDDRLFTLLDDMKEVLYNADGVGLAAVQVGILKRVVVIDVCDEHGFMELINPEIIDRKGEQRQPEGCLSLPHKQGVTQRPQWVKVKAQDRNGEWHEYEGEGLLARCFCHEFDHLDGKLFTENLAEGEEVYRIKD